METILGPQACSKVDVQSLTLSLRNNEKLVAKTELSEYGFIMSALEQVGLQGIYRGQLGSAPAIKSYGETARRYKEDMPALVLNASKYVSSVFNTIQDPELCMERLAGMSYPYVLWLLFASQGQPEIAECFHKEALEHYRRYPGTAELLPERFQTAVKELLANADTE